MLIDASNLHVGGGVQVAASFIDGMAELRRDPKYPWILSADIEASPTVTASLAPETRARLEVNEVTRRPTDLMRWVPKVKQYDVSFVVFGPEYGARRATHRIMGFADVTSIYPVPVPRWRSRVGRLRWAIRGAASRFLATKADRLVVETPAMAERLATVVRIPCSRITVVSNTYNAIFDRPDQWGPALRLPKRGEREVRLCYITRAYAHKNLCFLPRLASELDSIGVRARFIVTLKDDEWREQDESFRSVAINVGQLPIDSVPRVYEAADAAVFPSLLEAFSAMPVEAMRMGLPVFASDRDFVRTVCGESAEYFDPHDPSDAAEVIASTLANEGKLDRLRTQSTRRAQELPTAIDRARHYADLINLALPDAKGEVNR